MISLTRKFTFEMAHALDRYDGACRNIHGHSYKLFVTVSGTPSKDSSNPKLGMIIDFGELKRVISETILEKYDHSFVIKRGSTPPELLAMMRQHWGNIIEVDYQPTCENMVVEFFSIISANLPSGVTLSELKLYETENSQVTYRP